MIIKKKILTTIETKKIERVLLEYPHFESIEKKRRTELQQNSHIDENIGGGRSSSASNHAHENMVIRYSEDELINRIKHNKNVIENALNQLEPYQQVIVKLSYFQHFNKPTAKRIATITNVSRATVFRFRQDFIAYIYQRIMF